MPLLKVEDLSINFIVEGKTLPVVKSVSFELEKGEILALVGESGCGKSVTCMALTRLLPEPPAEYGSGKITFEHDTRKYDILNLRKKQLRQIRGGKIAYIFQEPSVSLNPVFRVGDQIAEAIIMHCPEVVNIDQKVIELLTDVGIPEPESRIKCYPHELSGGMQQRVMIAMALASEPDLLVADEPTTALDVTIQAQILELLCELRAKRSMSIILVTHNFGIVAEVADRVIVMYAGNTVEAAPVKELLKQPVHPYTRALLHAVPRLGFPEEKLTTIPGIVPSADKFPKGCRFFGRCELCPQLSADKQRLCMEEVPEWTQGSEHHYFRCWHSSMN